jgi:D-lactate dehydrogenase
LFETEEWFAPLASTPAAGALDPRRSAIFHQDAIRDAEDFKALVANHVLLRFPNVIVTPHNACNTEAAALERIVATTLANIEAFAQGTPQNVVSAY